MRRSSGLLGFALMVGLMAAFVVTTPAISSAASEDVYRENSDISKMFTKMGRGIVNVLTGWIEIPKNVAREWRETDPFTGLILGTIKGIGWGFGRTISGVYEIITFPFPIPRNYEPLMMPEYILPSIWGDSIPLFKDDFKSDSSSGSGSRYSYAEGPTYGKQAARDAANQSSTSP